MLCLLLLECKLDMPFYVVPLYSNEQIVIVSRPNLTLEQLDIDLYLPERRGDQIAVFS